MVDADEATRLLLSRELTLDEKREFVDLRIEGWLRTLPNALGKELRRYWAPAGTRQGGFDAGGDPAPVALEQLRGSLGA